MGRVRVGMNDTTSEAGVCLRCVVGMNGTTSEAGICL